MKNEILLSAFLIVTAAGFFDKPAFGQANTSLNNLAATTAVNAPILPLTNNTKNLGSTAYSWMNIYLDGNIFIGDAPFLKRYAISNNLIGGYAGYAITTGTNNTFTGDNTGRYTTSGYSNSFYGENAGFSNTEGVQNTFVGKSAGYLNNSNFNTAVGASAMLNNYMGTSNSAFGFNALSSNEWGNSNTAIGIGSLGINFDGIENTAVGADALVNNISGSFNTAVGDDALSINENSHYNTAVGSHSMGGFFEGGYGKNTAVGADAMSNIGGYSGNNVAIGYRALISVHGSANTAVGNGALEHCRGGELNTCIGYESDVHYENFSIVTAIGYSAKVDASNKVRLGNVYVSSIGGQVNWTAYSDGRIKSTIQENVPGLQFINELRPVTYHFDINEQNKLYGLIDTAQWEGKYDIEKIQWTGFIAQEVEAAANKIEYDFSGVDKSGKIMGLRYAEFVVPLVKSIQELSDRKSVLQATAADLEKRIAKLEAQLYETKTNTIQDANGK